MLLEQGDVSQLTLDYDTRWRARHVVSNPRYSTRALNETKVPPFIKKLNKFMESCKRYKVDNSKPRYNDFYRKYIKFDTFSKRITYLKTLTNTLLADHMDSKGWDSKQPGCRFTGC